MLSDKEDKRHKRTQDSQPRAGAPTSKGETSRTVTTRLIDDPELVRAHSGN